MLKVFLQIHKEFFPYIQNWGNQDSNTGPNEINMSLVSRRHNKKLFTLKTDIAKRYVVTI